MTGSLLEVDSLTVELGLRDGGLRPLERVGFSLEPDEVLGLVGESGSGKTMTALSIMRLIPPPPARVSGQIRFLGRDLLPLSEKEMRRIRGRDISMVFQEPMTSLDPVFTIGRQLVEVMGAHGAAERKEAKKSAIEMLEQVGITSPARRMDSYPHEFSGGMRQRVMIAMALLLKPKILIADEPTTALDVTVQAQILELLVKLQREFHMAVLLITHNLAVVAETASRVAVMYAGEIVETASTHRLFTAPQHPYTQGLLRSMPGEASRGQLLHVIEGRVPDLDSLPSACRFAPRCPHAIEVCNREHPKLIETDDGHSLRCWNPQPFAP